MSDPKQRTAHGQAQFEKKQVAAKEGAKAMLHYDTQAKAARINMEKLKALRLMKEAQEAEDALSAPPVEKVKKKRATKVGKSDAPKLGEWLSGQAKGGHRT